MASAKTQPTEVNMAQSVLGKADEKVTYNKDVKSDKSSSDHEKQDGHDDVVGAPPKLQRRLKDRKSVV